MKRLARWLLNALTVLSLLLCVATVALWVRSYRVTSLGIVACYSCADRYTQHVVSVLTRRGRFEWGYSGLRIVREEVVVPHGRIDRGWSDWNPTKYDDFEAALRMPPCAHRGRFAGVPWGWERESSAASASGPGGWSSRVEAIVPCWLAAVVTVAFPAVRLRNVFRRRRVGHCTDCGYDLTGNVSGVCPECGTKVGAPTHA